MSQIDLEINRNVRKVLVRNWIDLGRLSVRSTNGTLQIRGVLQRISGVSDELTVGAVETMFKQLKRISNVRNMRVTIENWTQVAGRWLPADEAATSDDGGASPLTRSP